MGQLVSMEIHIKMCGGGNDNLIPHKEWPDAFVGHLPGITATIVQLKVGQKT
jgi:hypothetical protein